MTIGVNRMPYLSARETEVLKLYALGNSHKLIAKDLGISQQTVKNHSTAINHKLNAFDKAHAVGIAYKLGILKTGDEIEQNTPAYDSPNTSDLPEDTVDLVDLMRGNGQQ